MYRSDPLLQKKKDKALGGVRVAGAETGRHAVTSSEPSTQAPADSLPRYHRITDVPPYDYIAKSPQATVDKVITIGHLLVISMFNV